MKTIIQTKKHVTVQLEWNELATLCDILATWSWGTGKKRIGGTSDERQFTDEFLEMVQTAIDQREIDSYKG